MKKCIACILTVFAMSLVLSGCNEPPKGIDLRPDNLVMRIPFAAIDGYVFYVEQLEGGKFKYDGRDYDIEGVFDALAGKQYSLTTRGVCLKTIGDMQKESAVIDRFVNFCIDRNMDLFIDLPYPEYVEKPENMDWIVQHKDQ